MRKIVFELYSKGMKCKTLCDFFNDGRYVGSVACTSCKFFVDRDMNLFFVTCKSDEEKKKE